MKCARCKSMACGGHSGNTYMQCHRCIMPIGMAMPSAGHDAVAFQHKKHMKYFDKKTVDVVVNPGIPVFNTYFITSTHRVVEDLHEGSGARLTGPSCKAQDPGTSIMVASSHADVKRNFTLEKPDSRLCLLTTITKRITSGTI